MAVYSGYIAPEYQINGVFSMKSDVFSFGVIVLEIITGERNRIVYPYADHLSLLEHVSIHPNIKSIYTSNAHCFNLSLILQTFPILFYFTRPGVYGTRGTALT